MWTRVERKADNILFSDLLEFGLFHNESLYEGLQDVADTLNPKFSAMSAILFTFCLACSLVLLQHSNGALGIDWVRSKPILGLAGFVRSRFELAHLHSSAHRRHLPASRHRERFWSSALVWRALQCDRQCCAIYNRL